MSDYRTTQEKLNALKSWYLSHTRKLHASTCPFGKNPLPGVPKGRFQDCSELCGTFPSLGDVRKGCPCQIFGTETSLFLLGRLLQKHRMLKDDE